MPFFQAISGLKPTASLRAKCSFTDGRGGIGSWPTSQTLTWEIGQVRNCDEFVLNSRHFLVLQDGCTCTRMKTSRAFHPLRAGKFKCNPGPLILKYHPISSLTHFPPSRISVGPAPTVRVTTNTNAPTPSTSQTLVLYIISSRPGGQVTAVNVVMSDTMRGSGQAPFTTLAEIEGGSHLRIIEESPRALVSSPSTPPRFMPPSPPPSQFQRRRSLRSADCSVM